MKNKAKVKTIYYSSLLGCIGGATGWFAILLLGNLITLPQNIFVAFAIRGAILGGLIGLSIAAYEGILYSSMKRFLVFGIKGLFIGSLGGAASLVLVQLLYKSLMASSNLLSSPSLRTFAIGLFCWIIFGGIIGFTESVGKGTQRKRGLAGGGIGGFIGGLIYEIARYKGNFLNESNLSYSDYITQAICFIVLGGAIGVFISAASNLFNFAELEVLNGKLLGRPFNITKFVHSGSTTSGIIGSDPSLYLSIPGDSGILKSHAIFSYENSAPSIKLTKDAEKTKSVVLVDNYAINSNPWPLNNGAIIQIGSTKLVYKQENR